MNSEPVTPEEFKQPDMAELLDQVGNMPEVASGTGSTKGPICPHCNRLFSPYFCSADGSGECPYCAKLFTWEAGRGPAGFAWQLWKKPNGK